MRWLIVCVLLINCCRSVHIDSEPEPFPEDTLVVRTTEYQEEIDRFLEVDTENKKWERIYLREIARAQETDDTDAYKFFIIEYIKIPRLIVPEWMKSEPGYVPKLTDADILRGEFRSILNWD